MGKKDDVLKYNNTYYTNLVTLLKEQGEPEPPFKGCGWIADLMEQRKRTSYTADGMDVVIQANSWERAQYALKLIIASIILYSGYSFSIEPDYFVAYNDNEPEEFPNFKERMSMENSCYSTTGVKSACMIAAKASKRKRWVYALAKYKFSKSQFDISFVELDPDITTNPYIELSPFPDDHVRLSYALISAYSVIEDLGLEIRASQKKPSIINGQWNPEVKQDLQKRLVDSGINLRKKYLWVNRGPKRRIELKRPLPSGVKAPWSTYPFNDTDIDLEDAILYSSWLRSQVASHGTKGITPSLSLYEVVNVQDLARRLLLEALGFWRYHERSRMF